MLLAFSISYEFPSALSFPLCFGPVFFILKALLKGLLILVDLFIFKNHNGKLLGWGRVC